MSESELSRRSFTKILGAMGLMGKFSEGFSSSVQQSNHLQNMLSQTVAGGNLSPVGLFQHIIHTTMNEATKVSNDRIGLFRKSPLSWTDTDTSLFYSDVSHELECESNPIATYIEHFSELAKRAGGKIQSVDSLTLKLDKSASVMKVPSKRLCEEHFSYQKLVAQHFEYEKNSFLKRFNLDYEMELSADELKKHICDNYDVPDITQLRGVAYRGHFDPQAFCFDGKNLVIFGDDFLSLPNSTTTMLNLLTTNQYVEYRGERVMSTYHFDLDVELVEGKPL